MATKTARHIARTLVLPASLLLPMVLVLPGCGSLQRLSEIGAPPPMTPISNPTRAPDWRPVSMPMPTPEPALAAANSLWRPGSRAFFKDQRASQVGDIITVVVNIIDSAVLTNATTATRTGKQSLGLPDLFGLQAAASKALRGVDLTKLVSTDSAGSAVGNGNISRGETVQLRVAGVITQVLPNGNLVTVGKQEVRINSELRELLVSGIIRPQDIASDNTVQHDRMAEARISYGGHGQLTDVQTPHYGQQILDIITPF
jgi:flagellar L-ring protein precursor FlgH